MCQVDSPLHLGFFTAVARQPVRQQPPHCARLRGSTGVCMGSYHSISVLKRAMPVRAGYRLGVAQEGGGFSQATFCDLPACQLEHTTSQHETPHQHRKMREKAAAIPWSSPPHKEMKCDPATTHTCPHLPPPSPPHLCRQPAAGTCCGCRPLLGRRSRAQSLLCCPHHH